MINNSEIYKLLVGVGIKNALIDAKIDRTIVSYEISNNIMKKIPYIM